MKPTALISLCACGVPCRYHGCTHKMGQRLMKGPLIAKLREKYELIPICPEQLGGLPVPRPPCDVSWDGDQPRVTARYSEDDFTDAYLRGAEWSCHMATLFGAERAYMLKQSPACDPKDGVTARELTKAGVRVCGI